MGWEPILTTKKKPTWEPILTLQKPQSAPLVVGNIGGVSTPQMLGANYQNPIGQLTQAAVQAPFKATGALLATGEQLITGKPTTFQPQVPYLQGNEPIASLQTQAQETYGGLRSMGYSPFGAAGITGAAVIGGTVLDLSPFGGSSKTAAKALVAARTYEEGMTIAKNLRLPPDLWESFAKSVSQINDAAIAERYLQNLEDTLRTTKPQTATAQNIAHVDEVRPNTMNEAWPTTASKQSKAGSTFTGSAPTGKGGVSAQRAGTSGPFDISPESDAWLDNLTKPRGEEELRLRPPTKQMETEFSQYKPDKPVKLYRGRNEAQDTSKPMNGLASWTYDPKIAEDFGTVVSRTFKPEDIFLDTTKLPGHLKARFGEEQEVFVKRSDYSKLTSIPKELEPLAAEARNYGGIRRVTDSGDFYRIQTNELKDGNYTTFLLNKARYTEPFGIKSADELTDFYNKATGGTPKGDTPFDVASGTSRPPKDPQPKGSEIPIPPQRGSDLPPTPPVKTSSYADSVPQDPVQKIIQALKEAKPLNKEQAAIYRAERAKRTAAVANMNAKGEAGYFKQLGALKGEMPKVQFEALRKSLKQEDIDSLFDMVEQNTKILPLEKVSAKGALTKILTGQVPTRSEIELLSEIFPKDFIKAILDKRDFWSKVYDIAGEVLNIPRSLMATLDVSAPLRQGIFVVSRVKQFAPAFAQMFKYLASEKAYRAMLEGIEARPTYKAMRQSKLALMDNASDSLLKREEAFMSNFAERIPLLGRGVKASGRAYSGFLTKLRADIFDDLLKQSKQLNIDSADLNEGIARYVNAATGRGDLGAFNRASVILNSTFFSPRLMASRLNLLNPIFYANLPPFVRKQALRDLLAFGAIAGSVLGLSKLAGAEVETDPTSADFAKAKFGNTRYDIMGGFQQYIRLANQLIQGRIKSSTTGREITLGEGYKPLTRKDILFRFFESKESPILSFATALMTGQDTQGRDINVPNEIVSRAIPLVVQDLYDLYQDKGLEGLVWGLPAPFGVGTQTYGKTELVEGENPIGQETAQVRPVPDLSKAIVEKLMGKQPLGNSKNFDVEVYFDQLKAMGPEKAKETLRHIAEVNPELAKDIIQVKKDRDAGITPHDRDLKAMGVASGDRAFAIIKDLEKKETPEEKKQLLKDLRTKNILTDDVWDQVKLLMGKQSNAGLSDEQKAALQRGVEIGKMVDPTGGVGAIKRVGGKLVGEVIKDMFKKNMPYGLLKNMEHFIDYVRLKKIPPGYDDVSKAGPVFEADFRDALAKLNPDVAKLPNSQLTQFLEMTLQKSKEVPNITRDALGRFTGSN